MMVLLAAIEVFGMLEAENGDGPHLPTWRGMTNHYHTFYIPVKCHFSTTSLCPLCRGIGDVEMPHEFLQVRQWCFEQ